MDPTLDARQISVRRPVDDMIAIPGGRAAWRSWCLVEKRRLEASPLWAEVWIHDDDDGTCALFGRPTSEGARRMGNT